MCSPHSGTAIAPSLPTFRSAWVSLFLFTWIMKQPIINTCPSTFWLHFFCNFPPHQTLSDCCQPNNMHLLGLATSSACQPGVCLHRLCQLGEMVLTSSFKDSLSHLPLCLFLHDVLFSGKSFHLCLSKGNLSPRHLNYFMS